MMDFEYVVNTYDVPACVGRRVEVDGKPGIIVADKGHYIGVNFDSDKPGVISNCHPTWRVAYLGIGAARQLTKSQQRYKRYLEVAECFDDFMHFCRYEDGTKKAGI